MSGFETFTSCLTVSGAIETRTPLRIGAGKSTSATEPNQPVVKDILGYPVIPGSSLKGALRSHIEAIMRAVVAPLPPEDALAWVCDPFGEEAGEICLAEAQIKDIKEDPNLSPETRDERIIEHTCLTCRLFGSHGVAAKFAVRDLPVIREYWGGRYLIRDGVAIDRDKGTAADKRKYDFEAVPTGTRFAFQVQVDNAGEVELGLALLALRALEQEQVQLGGARSRGLGWCRLVDTEYLLYEDPITYLLGQPGERLDEGARQARMDAFVAAIREQNHA